MKDSKAFRIVVWFALGIIPMIYAGLLVWSNQDPTGSLSHVPAAIVEEDAGTSVTAPDGTAIEVNLGEQLTTNLTTAAAPAFDWSVLDADAAAKQLDDGTILAVLTIPSGFSADALAAASGTATVPARLEIRTDDAQNFIVGTVAKTIGTTIADSVSAQVRTQYLASLYQSSPLIAASGQAAAMTQAEAAARAAVAAQPVLLDAVRDHSVGIYGAGLAPYFLSLGLWVGALGTFMMRAPLSERLLRRRSLAAPLVALRSYWPTALLGLAQALAAVLVLRLWVGIPMAELAGVAGIAAVTSLTFMAVNQGLVGLLGPSGRFVALLLVVLQLAAAGGTYPIQTAAPFFQAIHAWLPVSHSMNAFRMLIAGGGQSVLPDILVLLAWLVGGLALATVGVILTRRREARAVVVVEDEIAAELGAQTAIAA